MRNVHETRLGSSCELSACLASRLRAVPSSSYDSSLVELRTAKAASTEPRVCSPNQSRVVTPSRRRPSHLICMKCCFTFRSHLRKPDGIISECELMQQSPQCELRYHCKRFNMFKAGSDSRKALPRFECTLRGQTRKLARYGETLHEFES